MAAAAARRYQEEIVRGIGMPGQGNVEKDVRIFVAPLSERLDKDQGYGRIFRALRDEWYIFQTKLKTVGHQRSKEEKAMSGIIALAFNSALKLYKAENKTGLPLATSLEHSLDEEDGHTRDGVAYHKNFFIASSKTSGKNKDDNVHELFLFLHKPIQVEEESVVEGEQQGESMAMSDMQSLEFELVPTGIAYTADRAGMQFYLSALNTNFCAAVQLFQISVDAAGTIFGPPCLLRRGIDLTHECFSVRIHEVKKIKAPAKANKRQQRQVDDLEERRLLLVKCCCSEVYTLGWSKSKGLVRLPTSCSSACGEDMGTT